MKRKPPTGGSPLACAYRLAATSARVSIEQKRGPYLLLAALAARQFWAYEWHRRWGLATGRAAWEARQQADLWLDLIERLRKETKP